MITNEQKKVIIESILEGLDIPDSAYDKAQKRYEDLGEWFSRDESIVSKNNPHIFPQGSFRLGTVIRPIDESDKYDLDLACKLQDEISKCDHTQETLKNKIGIELEAYRKARNIKKELEEKHRCWRLEYQDEPSFHMDMVPCIPADENRRKAILESIRKTGLDEYVAGSASQTTISITDDRHEGYKHICDDWNISNPEGYAKWFEYRMNPQQTRILLKKAQVDDVPLFKKKTPLQRVIQILKRHRDNWSKDNPDSKPISIIITTLAARAYNGETDIVAALDNVLEKMGDLVSPTKPRVPNPVDPEEDFADRWYRDECSHLRLEDRFNAWLRQAKNDFQSIISTADTEFLCKQIGAKFSLQINQSEMKKKFGINVGGINITPATSRLNVALPKKSIFAVAHRQEPHWPRHLNYSVQISAKYKTNDSLQGFNSGEPLNKNYELFFNASTNTPVPFHVYWQVVNTGKEAEEAGQLRGEIKSSKIAGVGGLRQKESTSYTGIHWVECFIVKNDVCVAHSNEFVVDII